MRIENNWRVGSLGGRTATARPSSAFHVADSTTMARSDAASQLAPATSLEALLALQAVEDPLLKKKKLVRRGTQLLDTLDELKADLLSGHVSDSRLNRLMALLGQARENIHPQLDALIDDIELRARVELAKRGLYPA